MSIGEWVVCALGMTLILALLWNSYKMAHVAADWKIESGDECGLLDDDDSDEDEPEDYYDDSENMDEWVHRMKSLDWADAEYKSWSCK